MAIKAERLYTYLQCNESQQGDKIFYNCKIHPDCSSKACLHLPCKIYIQMASKNMTNRLILLRYWFTDSSKKLSYFVTFGHQRGKEDKARDSYTSERSCGTNL
jgi:hypothetical protein